MSERTEFVERRSPLLGGALFFAMLGGYAAWSMFIQGSNPEMMLGSLDLTPTHPIGWLALFGAVFMVGLMLWRATASRMRIILEGDLLRFGYRGVREVRRGDVAAVDAAEDGVVRLKLVRPITDAMRARAQLPEEQHEVVLLDQRLEGPGPLGPAVQRWFDAAGTTRL